MVALRIGEQAEGLLNYYFDKLNIYNKDRFNMSIQILQVMLLNSVLNNIGLDKAPEFFDLFSKELKNALEMAEKDNINKHQEL